MPLSPQPQTFALPPPPQVWGGVHVPQLLSGVPQPLSGVPQFAPRAAQVVGVQPQTFALPPPPQVFLPEHVPQFCVPPQPSGAVPQLKPSAAHVIRGQHFPCTNLVPLGQGAQRIAVPPWLVELQTKPWFAQQVCLPSHDCPSP
jgi:hypothetical protein